MKNKILFFISCGLLSTLPYNSTAQERPAEETTRQIQQIAADIPTHPEAAAQQFHELLKGKNKKNVSLLVAVGNAYLAHNCLEEAQTYADQALKTDPRAAGTYVLAGDVALARKKVGEACGYYEQAILFDADCNEAYYKYARAYIGVNPSLSVEMLTKLKARHPEQADVDRELGNVYYQSGNYAKAKSAYETFMQRGTPGMQDYERYAMLLYLNKNYAQSLQTARKGLGTDAHNHLLLRLQMYDLYETGACKEGLEAADVFFNGPAENDYVYLDYLYQGRLLLAEQQTEQALKCFEKALQADPRHEHPEIAKEVSAVQEKLQHYPEAIRLYELYMNHKQGQKEISDLFLLGRLYYMAAGNTCAEESEKETYLKKADEIFAQVSQKAPDNYLGYFWRARTNAMADPESTEGRAKPYYEAALALLEKKADASQSLLIECESYLGYYYFLQKDYAQSQVYWKKILELDPENATARQALQGL